MAFVLVVEDNDTLRAALVEVLGAGGHEVQAVASAEEALARIEDRLPELVLSDLRLPGMGGQGLLEAVKGRDPLVEVLMITAYGTVETAVAAMRAGAFDFLTKPVRMDHLQSKVEQALCVRRDRLALVRERERRQYLEAEVEAAFNEGQIVGRSPEMLALYRQIEKIAASPSSVLVSGESGTGKELVARAIHMRSPRREAPFVRVNCGALPAGVLESELFGHEKGAFTGATRQRRGRFELADGGTLFLDEISDIEPAVQVRLLRVLQEREFERVGGERTLHVDVRVIAATHSELRAEVAEGRFREDLFYRLYVIPLHLPPLRDRKEDIPLLADHFIERLCAAMGRPRIGLSTGALRLLTFYDWPGNVRELENALERALVLCEENQITEADLPFLRETRSATVPLPRGVVALNSALEELERAMLQRAMERAHGVKAEAARLLQIKPSALYYKLEKHGLL
ncbi:MAG: sigma-54-dependent Fis family transcriptional regulator [Candidatus Eisenbacteria sp.]|nr:sigma-54-dependent Fis family transcriptional regulator [Candidatus Eisenbacteria bacterium]